MEITESIQNSLSSQILVDTTKMTNKLQQKPQINMVKSFSAKKTKNAFLTYSNKKMRDFLQLSTKKKSTVTMAQTTSSRHMTHQIKSFTSTGSTASSYTCSSSSSSSTGSSVCYMDTAAAAVSFKSKLKRKLFVKSSMKLLANNKKQLDLSYACDNNNASQEDDENKNHCFIETAKMIATDQSTQIEKESGGGEEFGNIITNIYKIMDKSLGWLKSKSTSKKTAHANTCNFSQENESYHTYSSQSKNACDGNASPLLINAPSMTSSFDMSKLRSPNNRHSTPRSLLQQTVSPIFSPHQPSSAKTSASSLASRRRRLSFSGGVTSSPKSASSSSSSSVISEPVAVIPHSTFFTASRHHEVDDDEENETAAEYFVDSRVLNHIDQVKRRSIRLTQQQQQQQQMPSVCDGHFGSNMFESFCHANETVAKTSKRRKLQQIFQVKLKKQLKELRKWHVNDLNDDEDEDEHRYANRRRMHSSRIVQTHEFSDHPSTCVCYQCFVAFRALMQKQQTASNRGQFYTGQQQQNLHQSNRYLIQNNNVYNQYCSGYRSYPCQAVTCNCVANRKHY